MLFFFFSRLSIRGLFFDSDFVNFDVIVEVLGSILGTFGYHFGDPGVPGDHLGVPGDHLGVPGDHPGAPIRVFVDFSSILGPPREPIWLPLGICFHKSGGWKRS